MKKEDKSNLVDGVEDNEGTNGDTYPGDEPAPPKKSPRMCCNWKLEGLTLVILVVVVFSLAITVAMVIHILVGPPQVVPHGAAASSSKLCANAATEMMKKGGNGVDGAIAAALCEAVVLGHKTGFGGGMLIHVYSQKSRNSTLFDCREAAPASATSDMFKGRSSKATEGGSAVAVPGFVRCLFDAHTKFGAISWSSLFAPAIRIAKAGFPMPKDLHHELQTNSVLLNLVKRSPQLSKIYLVAKTTPVAIGTTIKREDLATVLNDVGKHGAAYFYKGALANEVVDATNKDGGNLTATDLSAYATKNPKPIRGHFNHFTLLSFPLPSIGGPVLLATLNALDAYGIYRSLLPNETNIPHQVKAPNNLYYQRLVEILRSTITTSTKFGSNAGGNNTDNFLSPAMARTLVKIVTANTTSNISGNEFPPVFSLPSGDSQLSVQGPKSLMVTIASSLGGVFGSGVVTKSGVVLNNAMGAFSLPDVGKVNSHNLPGPGLRPNTPLAPFVAFNPRRRCGVRFAGGSSGGLKAPQVGVQVAVAALLWDVPKCREKDCVNLRQALLRARLAVDVKKKIVNLENTMPGEVITFLKSTGHTVKGVKAIGDANMAGEVQHVVKAAADLRAGGAISAY